MIVPGADPFIDLGVGFPWLGAYGEKTAEGVPLAFGESGVGYPISSPSSGSASEPGFFERAGIVTGGTEGVGEAKFAAVVAEEFPPAAGVLGEDDGGAEVAKFTFCGIAKFVTGVVVACAVEGVGVAEEVVEGVEEGVEIVVEGTGVV